mgnify:CR=1 FL=1
MPRRGRTHSLDAAVQPAPENTVAAFKDGRAYSQARLLRERYAYRGELRATGQVLRDQFVLHWSSERPVPQVTIDFGDVIAPTWYTYDENGDAVWFLVAGALPQQDGSYAGDVYRFTGVPFEQIVGEAKSANGGQVGTDHATRRQVISPATARAVSRILGAGADPAATT